MSNGLNSSEEFDTHDDDYLDSASKNGPIRNSKGRSKKDITVLREESKNRQKLLRAQMKDLFRELASVLRPPLDSNQEKTKAILQRAIEYIRYCNQIIDQQGSQRAPSPNPSHSPYHLASDLGSSPYAGSSPFSPPHRPEVSPPSPNVVGDFVFPPEMYNTSVVDAASVDFTHGFADDSNYLMQNFLGETDHGFEIDTIPRGVEVRPRGAATQPPQGPPPTQAPQPPSQQQQQQPLAPKQQGPYPPPPQYPQQPYAPGYIYPTPLTVAPQQYPPPLHPARVPPHVAQGQSYYRSEVHTTYAHAPTTGYQYPSPYPQQPQYPQPYPPQTLAPQQQQQPLFHPRAPSPVSPPQYPAPAVQQPGYGASNVYPSTQPYPQQKPPAIVVQPPTGPAPPAGGPSPTNSPAHSPLLSLHRRSQAKSRGVEVEEPLPSLNDLTITDISEEEELDAVISLDEQKPVNSKDQHD